MSEIKMSVEEALNIDINDIVVGDIWSTIKTEPYFNIVRQALQEKQEREQKWISVSERLPESEKEVEVTVKRKYENKEHTFTCRAIYENGEIWRENSNFYWNDFDNVVYDKERDDWKVPKGWFEAVSYAEEFSVIDDFVLAWQPLPEPYKEVTK